MSARLCALPLVCLLVGMYTDVRGQEPMALTRITSPVRVDGVPDEPGWSAVPPLPVVMYQPVHRGKMTERTVIRVGYDDHYLYVAGELYDSVPSGIRGNTMYRDQYSGDDTFAIILDAFNDNENALWFFTTPNGVRVDLAVTNDASGGFESANISWNTYWDAATSITDEGWFAELRIPFSSLGFQTDGSSVEMGMTAYRYIARTNERHIFPDIPPNWSTGFAKASQTRKVSLTGVTSSKPLYVTPYVLGGYGRFSELNASETRYVFDDTPEREVGLDVKYSLTSNLTVDMTVNTDFAQVEADNQEVNLTRFSLFFPEKRQFFQERAGIFNYDLGGPNRVFHSRRIGLDEDGAEVRIYGGARLVGRVGQWDVGLINMQTEKKGGGPSENFGVLRLRRRVLNPHSYVGTIATSRLGADGTYNVAYGVDGTFRVTGDEYVLVQMVQTVDDAVLDASGYDPLEVGVLRTQWERRTTRGLAYTMTLSRVGGSYRPDVGFAERTDYWRPAGRVAYGWFPGDASPFRHVTSEVSGALFFRLADGSVESAEAEHEWNVEFKSGVQMEAEVELAVEDLVEPLELSDDAVVPPGRYSFAAASAGYTARDGALFRPALRLTAGRFFDGNAVSLSLSPTWNVSRHLELGGQLEAVRIRFPSRDQKFDFVVGRLRTQVAFDTRASISAFVQYNSAADIVSANLRMRYNFREGRDLWIVYNEGINTDRQGSDPMLPVTDSRTLLLKYTHTFDL